MLYRKLFVTAIVLVAVQVDLTFSQDVSFGEAFEVGSTFIQVQHNGTIGKMVARDSRGGTHFAWTNSVPGGDVSVWYNYCNDNSGSLSDQLGENNGIWSESNNSRGVTIEYVVVGRRNAVCPVGFYQGEHGREGEVWWLKSLVAPGIDYVGFEPFEIPFYGPDDSTTYFPKGSVDRNLRTYLVAAKFTEDFELELVFWKAELEEDWWDDWNISDPALIEPVSVLSHRVQAAIESDRVAVAWHHNLVGVPPPEAWQGSLAWQMNNDLYLYESPDGEEWDFENATNITNTLPLNLDLDAPFVYGDTLRPYTDVDILYDGEVCHAVFTTCGLWLDPTGERVPPVERISTSSLIWHWDSDSDTLTLVADGWYQLEHYPASWKSTVCRPSIGIDEEGILYCIFRKITEDDINEHDVYNGEIMLSISEDRGITWSEPINLTGTIAEDPEDDEEYVNETQASLAERVDESLHLFYMSDFGMGDDQWTRNLMLYQRIPVDELPDVDDLEMPREGFQYHNRFVPDRIVGDPVDNAPEFVSIDELHPNPFNSSFRIQFTIKVLNRARLALFDCYGREIAVLLDRRLNAGQYSETFDASNLPSGVYTLRLNAGNKIAFTKLVCIK